MQPFSRRTVLGYAALSASASVLPVRAVTMSPLITTLAEGLAFPEGPVALPDGSIALCEIMAGRIGHVHADGKKDVLAVVGGAPNGMAMGRDGALYVANAGGVQYRMTGNAAADGQLALNPPGARIQRVDIPSGKVTTLYLAADGAPLESPDDLVIDKDGGLWISDLGRFTDRARYYGGIIYASPDRRTITRAAYPLLSPNGIALSADGRTLYVTLSEERFLVAFDILGPGKLTPVDDYAKGRLVASATGRDGFDSIKLEQSGNICVCAGDSVHIYSPNGGIVDVVKTPDSFTTNLCFGGKDLRTAYITGSAQGVLYKTIWPRSGLRQNFQFA